MVEMQGYIILTVEQVREMLAEVDKVEAEAYNEGFEDGRAQGYDEGFSEGVADGYDEGYGDGHFDGRAEEAFRAAEQAAFGH